MAGLNRIASQAARTQITEDKFKFVDVEILELPNPHFRSPAAVSENDSRPLNYLNQIRLFQLNPDKVRRKVLTA